ncbi:hypothetical protein TNIN_474131 [Trichonephila inaurata madagascariensis]|uniref:Uncharacterized protein n=1 Tax=Trichonephila inaurata madagascariensis TaxID=2747483 RepID=A0A8X7CI22_9ARAC|nr:hypothetical protein TNIN_474131 [Trichonephila inaurata madagascariensis]
MGGYVHIGNVIRFLEEAVAFYLEYNNLNWEPPSNSFGLICCYVPLFSRSIGTAITHHCMESLALEYEPDAYFDLNDSLQSSGSEAGMYIHNFVRRYMDFLPGESYYEYLCFICYICLLCVLAIIFERRDKVYLVILEAASVLYFSCNHHSHYINIAQAAIDYNLFHRAVHDESEDDGFFSASEDEEG